MDKQNRVLFAQLPAAVDHFLAAALHFRVVALYRGKIQIGVGLAGGHRRGCAAAQTDVHRRATQHHQFGADGDFTFLHVIGADVADTARQHDRFVITAQLDAVMAVNLFFIGTEVSHQRRTAKFIIERRAAQWAVGHDIQCGYDAIRLAKILLPGLLEAGDAQVGNREAHQTGFGFGTATCSAFVADLATRTGSGTRPRGDRRRVVMGFHLHQDMGLFLMIVILTALRRSEETANLRTFHHGGVVFISR